MKKSTALRMTAISGFGFELINLGTTVAQIYHERTMHLAQVRLVFSVAGGILVYFSADDTPRPKPKPAPRDAQPRSDARALIGAFESGAFAVLLEGTVAAGPLRLDYSF